MKKILFYLEGIYCGGTEIALYNLLTHLDTNKYENQIMYSDHKNSYEPLIEKMKKYATIVDINDKINTDILIYCTTANNDADKVLQNVKYKKAYYWFHFFSEKQINFLKYNITNNNLDGVIAVSEASKRRILEFDELKGKENKVMVINNILDDTSIIEKSKEPVKMNLSPNLNLITAARFAPKKGYERVKELADALIAQNVEFKWFILGEETYIGKEYGQKVREMFKPYNNIELLGNQDNPYKYMKNCDYAVVLSEVETWSLVISEAKILGIPCICSDFDSVKEQIENMYNGIIINTSNPNAYMEVVPDIINNKQKFKQNLRNFKYDISSIINKWENIIEQ